MAGPTAWGSDIPQMENLVYEIAIQISESAELGLTKEEILEGWLLDWHQLTKQEQYYFEKEYAAGKYRGLKNIARDLTAHSKKPQGLAATMAYLRRFSTNFEKQLNDDTTSQEESFIFNFSDRVADEQAQIKKDEKKFNS